MNTEKELLQLEIERLKGELAARGCKRPAEDRLFSLLMETGSDLIYFKDTDSKFIRVNKSFATRFRVKDPAQLVGMSDSDLFSEEHASQALCDEQAIVATGTPLIGKIEKETGHDGAIRWVTTTKFPLRDEQGTIVGTYGISRDITAHKQSQDELLHERDLLRQLIDNIPDTIYFKDSASRFTIVNKAQADFMGITDASLARGKTDFEYFDRNLASAAFADEQLIMKSGQALVGKIERVAKADGTFRWYSSTKIPIVDAEDAVIGTCGISRDITTIKHYEDELTSAKSQLELRIAQRTADLQTAKEGLETRLAQLNFLNESLYDLAQFIRLEELAPAIVAAFRSRIAGSEAILCLHSPQGYTCVAASPKLCADQTKRSAEQSLQVFHRAPLQAPFMVVNWRDDEYIGHMEWPALDNLTVYCAIPFLADNTTIAILQLFVPTAFVSMYSQEQPVLALLAAHAGVCLTNTLQYKELGQKARLDGELDAARTIQQRFTPVSKPLIPHINLKGVYYPAYEVSGDYLDYFENDAGDWVIVIADVCGKCVPAALLMTMLRSTFRSEARRVSSSKQLLSAVNDQMRINLDNKSFVTALCLIVNKAGTAISYSRAGHPFLLKVGSAVEHLPCEGIALGLVPEQDVFNSMLEEVTVPLKKGDRFLIYTDGLLDATNANAETYGLERLTAMLTSHTFADADSLIDALLKDVRLFVGALSFSDDLTMLAFEVTG